MRIGTAHVVVLTLSLLAGADAVGAAADSGVVRFEPNQGQADPRWGFVARTGDGRILLGEGEVRVGGAVVTLSGSNPEAVWEAIEPLPGRAHYLLGSDPERWVLDVPTFAGVVRRSVYPGVDVVARGTSQGLILGFDVAPEADAGAIALQLDGVGVPHAFRPVGQELRIDVPEEARSAPVHIEVSLEMDDLGTARELPRLARDTEGNLFIAGSVAGEATRFVSMLDPSGRDVVRTTYLDGFDAASPVALAVARSGEMLVAGRSAEGAVLVRVDRDGRKVLSRTVLPGSAALAISVGGDGSAWIGGGNFLAQVDPLGQIVFSTPFTDEVRGVAVDREGAVYVTGTSGDEAFVAKLDKAGSPIYTTRFGDEGAAIAVTERGEAVFTGGAFVAQLDASGSVVFSTDLDGRAVALALDPHERAWVVGTRGADAFVTQISLEKRSVVREAVLAGERDDLASGVVVDGNGDAVVAGLTLSDEIPEAQRPESTRGGEVFVARVGSGDASPQGVCPGSKNFTGIDSSAWEDADNWSGGVLPTAADNVCISGFNVALNGTANAGTLRVEGGSLTLNGGTLTVAGASEVSTLTVSGGTLTGAGNVTVSGTFTFTSGTLSGSGITTTDGPTTISGTLTKGLFAHRWDANGPVTWTGTGSLTVSSGAIINNAGTWDCQSDAALVWAVGGATAFNNLGTFKKSAGAGTTTLQAPFYNTATGTMLVQAGSVNSTQGGTSNGNFDLSTGTTLQFGGGIYHFAAGTTITGSGTILLSASELDIDAAIAFPAGITFNMTGGWLGGVGTLTAAGTVNFTGGTMQDGGVTTCNGPLNLTGAVAKGLLGRTLNNNATAIMSGTGSFSVASGGVINNSGTWDAQSDATVVNSVGSGTAFNNSGTFKKSAGVGTSTMQLPFNNTGSVLVQTGTVNSNQGGVSTGSFDMAAGTTLQLNGGTYHMNAGTTFSGSGRVLLSATTLDVNAAIGIPATMTFDMTGGVLTGTGTLTTAGPLNWTGGTMQSTGVTTCNGALNISGAVAKGIQLGRTLNNNATATMTGTGNLNVSTAAVINNPDTWDFQSDASIVWGVGTAPVFNNTGTLKKSAGTGTSFVQLPFVNDGVVLVQTGTINSNQGGSSTGNFGLSTGTTLQFGGGTFALNAGTTFTGIGNVLLTAATLNVNAAVGIPATIVVDMTGGTMQGAATFTADGIFNYSGGAFGNAGITNFNGALNVFGTAAKGISSRTLNTNGITTWSGVGTNLGLSFGASINNNGTWEVLSDGSMAWGVGAAPVFRNLGTFRKSVGVGTTTLNLPYQNQGTVDIQTGTISANNYTQTAGTTKLTGGSFSSTVNIQIQGGTLAGSGTVTGPVVVSGTGALSPGLSAGTLALAGNYTQQAANGAFNVEIGGLTPGTQHDRANVTGTTTTLAGVLNVSLIGGFVPLPGDTFTIMTHGTRTGTFATVNFPSVGCIGWRLSYGANAIVLTAAAVPEEIAALTMTSKTAMSWAAAPVYANTSYNVLRGDLDTLPVGPGADETCVVPSTTATTASDAATPVLGKGFWYLVREQVTSCGAGTYGSATSGAPRVSTACP